MIKALTTSPISTKHVGIIKQQFPQLDLRVCNSIEEAGPYLGEAEILLTYGEDLTDEIIDRTTNLKWINVLSAGLEMMPFKRLQSTEVIVTNSKGIHKVQMSEYAIGVMLMLMRRSLELYDNQKNKVWDRSVRLDELDGKVLGIVGLGTIGMAIAEKAKAFNMKVIGTKANPKPMEGIDEVLPPEALDQMLEQSDFVIVLTPLTEETRNMFDINKFSKMNKNSYFINMARGAVVVEKDLIKALEDKLIQGAVLDVFVNEPLPEDSPLWDAPNIIITPHMSGRSPKYMERAIDIFKANAEAYINNKGEMINVIDKEKGY